MRVMREETFGPVVPVVEMGTLDEAIEMANSVPYALGANVYTKDFEKMLRCMRGFGGQRDSGIGRELAARASKPSRRRSTST